MIRETATEKLFQISNAFDYSNANSTLFVDAMREMIEFHRQHSSLYHNLCKIHRFSVDQLTSEADLFRIPHIIVTAFKEQKLLSLPEHEIVRTFTSSGTTGQTSQINWDSTSQERQLFMRASIVSSFKLKSDKPCNYLCCSYDPESSGTKGAANTFQQYMTFAPAAETVFALGADQASDVTFRITECVEALTRFKASNLPLRVTGFPAFIHGIIQELERRDLSFAFPEDSLIFTGGGWKTFAEQQIPFPEFAQRVTNRLGIEKSRIRDVFGMVEHGVPYISCEENHFHVPIYGRVMAIDPATMAPLPTGKTGLLKLLTPYIRSVPAVSILSTDLGELHSNCPCGRPGQYLVLRGRGGVRKHKGCAISASQLLNN